MSNFNKFLEKNLLKKAEKKKQDHAILDKEPHFIFSVENPIYPEKQTAHTSHNDMIQKLNDAGMNAQGIYGKYGAEEESSILVHNPTRDQVKKLHQIAGAHGQESAIYSDGHNHELHFYHGDDSGFYNKGKGTVLFDQKPEDHFSHLGIADKGGEKYFRHNIDFESHFQQGTHKPREQVEQETAASEEQKKAVQKKSSKMSKAEDDHSKDSLVHYSSQSGLKDINPTFQGKGVDIRTKGRSLENKVSFFYRHGTEPESIVTQGAKSKYVTKLTDDHKLYDMGKDPESHIKKLSEDTKAHNEKNPQQQKYMNTDAIYDHLKEKGYHGIFNSTHDSLSNIVAMFEKMPVHSEHPVRGGEKVVSASNKEVEMKDNQSRLEYIRAKAKAMSEKKDEEEEEGSEELNFTHRRMFKAEEDSGPKPSGIKINPDHGKTIADAYDKMKHDPNHPDVKKAYAALVDETKSQYKDILKSGIKISRIEKGQENPYKNSKELHHDIKNNNHLHFYPTDVGFGGEDEIKNSDHPMLKGTGIKHEGKELLANDLFRIVHDINGHHLGGESGFGPTGEHKAFLAHNKMYSTHAQKALATETLGQNSWVNFGPHGEHNKKNPSKTKYPEQKAGLLPDDILNKNWHTK